MDAKYLCEYISRYTDASGLEDVYIIYKIPVHTTYSNTSSMIKLF